jgi:MFS family permease
MFLLALLTGLNLLNYFDRFILSSVVEPLKAEFLLSDSEVGWLATAFIFGYFLTCPIFGYLGDRMPRKWLIAAGIFIWSLATFMTGHAQTFSELIFYRVLVGIGEASYATLGPALLCDAFPKKRHNYILTIFYVAIPLGAALGSIFGSYVGAHYGWRNAFLWAGFPGLLLSLSLLPFSEPKHENKQREDLKPTLKDIFDLRLIPKFTLVVWGYVAYTFALGAYQYWGQAFLQRQHGIELAAAGQFFGGTMVITGLLGTFVGGYLAGKAQAKSPTGYASTIGWSVLLAIPFCLIFTLSDTPILAQSSIAIAMFLLFIPTGPVNVIIIDAVPTNLRATAMALTIFTIHACGDLWSPYLVGAIADHFESMRIGMTILPLALIVCAYLWLKLAYSLLYSSISEQSIPADETRFL